MSPPPYMSSIGVLLKCVDGCVVFSFIIVLQVLLNGGTHQDVWTGGGAENDSSGEPVLLYVL